VDGLRADLLTRAVEHFDRPGNVGEDSSPLHPLPPAYQRYRIGVGTLRVNGRRTKIDRGTARGVNHNDSIGWSILTTRSSDHTAIQVTLVLESRRPASAN
jgi:hypothetical protein